MAVALENDLVKKFNRKERILIIGSVHTNPTIEICMGLQKRNDVQFFTTGRTEGEYHCDFKLNNCFSRTEQFEDQIFNMGRISAMNVRRMKLESLLDVIGHNFDYIIHFHDWIFFTDIQKCHIPYFYIPTEIWFPWVPQCAWGVFPEFYGTKEVLETYFPNYNFNLWIEGCQDFMLDKEWVERERENRICFAGGIYVFNELYQKRRDILKYVNENLNPIVKKDFNWTKPSQSLKEKLEPEVGRGRLNLKEYKSMFENAQIGINVPWGGHNFRDIETCGSGTMLLTRHTKDHDIMGFVDGENCRFYDSPAHAVNIIENMDDEEISRIAYNGWKMVREKYNYDVKTEELLNLCKNRILEMRGYSTSR